MQVIISLPLPAKGIYTISSGLLIVSIILLHNFKDFKVGNDFLVLSVYQLIAIQLMRTPRDKDIIRESLGKTI